MKIFRVLTAIGLIVLMLFVVACTNAPVARDPGGGGDADTATEAQTPDADDSDADTDEVDTNDADATDAGTADADPDEIVELRVLTYDDDWFDDVLADFERLNPGINVTRSLGQGIDTGAITAMLSAGDAPDVLLVNSGPGRVLPLARAGLLADLTDYYVSRGWEENANPSILAIIDRNDERRWEISNGMDVFSFYYHIEIFEELGISAPETWDEFVEINEIIYESGMTPIIAGGRDNFQLGWNMGQWLQSIAGYDHMTGLIYDDVTSFLDGPWIQAQEMFLDFFDRGFYNSDIVALDGNEAMIGFVTRQAAMVVANQGSFMHHFEEGSLEASDISSFAMPSYIGETAIPTAGMAHSWVMNIDAAERDAALLFLDYVASMDYQVKLASMNAWRYGIGAIMIPDLAALNLHPIVEQAFEQLAFGTGYNPSVYLQGDLRAVYFETNQELFTRIRTAHEIAEILQETKEAFLRGDF